MGKKLLAITFVLLASTAQGQYTLSPLNNQLRFLVEEDNWRNQRQSLSPYWPVMVSFDRMDSLLDADTKNWERKTYDSWFMRKVRNEHLFEIRSKGFKLNGDAAINLEVARQADAQGRRRFTNSRGFNFNGTIGDRVFFGTSFYETQSILPAYMQRVVFDRGAYDNVPDPERGSIPGYGRWKPFNTSTSYDYDYTLGTGYVGVAISEHSYLQFGHDKQFLGYGYRSLFLGDASAPYPMLRTHLSWFDQKLTYTTTWAVLQSLQRVASVNYNNKEALFRRLGGRFSYLHFQPVQWLGAGLFDGSTWRWRDNDHPESIEYYMPYSFAYSGNGIFNRIMGVNAFVQPIWFAQLYTQYGRNLGTGSTALQVGAKVQGLPEHLTVQLEWNRVATGFYFDGRGTNNTRLVSEPFEAGTDYTEYYQHMDQSLGHPWMAPMDEFLFRLNYRVRDIFVQASLQQIYLAPQISQEQVQLITGELGYIINPRSNLQIVAGNIYRRNSNKPDATTGQVLPIITENYTYVALRTALFNRYLDY